MKQTLIGVRNLAEYEILVEDLNITTSQNNHSLALVKVVFRRQGGFHLLTSFVSRLNITVVPFIMILIFIYNSQYNSHQDTFLYFSGTITRDYFCCLHDLLFPREELFRSDNGESYSLINFGNNQLNSPIGKMHFINTESIS